MNVLVVGCGAVGSTIAGMLAKEEDVNQVICADANLSLAKKTARDMESLRVSANPRAESVDAGDSCVVAQVARGADVVFNATFPKFNLPILKACLTVGAHYLDLLSLAFDREGHPGETLEDQLELDDDLKAAGLTALPNMGTLPGFANIVTHYFVDQLDEIDNVKLKFGGRIDSDTLINSWSPAVYMSEYFNTTGAMVWDGGLKEVDMLGSAEEVEFPEPIGRIDVYTVTTTTEIYTIPRYLSELTGKRINYVEVKGGIAIGSLSVEDVWIEAIRRAIKNRKSTFVEKEELTSLWGSSFVQPSEFMELYNKGLIKDASLGGSIEVNGWKNDRQVRHTLYWRSPEICELRRLLPWATPTGYNVGASATIATLMIGRGEIKRKGVIVPEWLDGQTDFIDKMRERKIFIRKKTEVT